MSVRRPAFVLLDLDGPVLDVRDRYFACHVRAAHGMQARALDRDTYWNAKRRRTSLADILGTVEGSPQIDRYRARWLERIESDGLLALDRLQPGARDALERLGAVQARVAVTLRDNTAGARATLERLALASLFTHIEILPHAAASKEEAFRRHTAGVDPADVAVIGDTEHDVLPARALGMTAVAVSCGIRDAGYLVALGADAVVETLAAAVDLLLGAATRQSETPLSGAYDGRKR